MMEDLTRKAIWEYFQEAHTNLGLAVIVIEAQHTISQALHPIGLDIPRSDYLWEMEVADALKQIEDLMKALDESRRREKEVHLQAAR
jgi:hypothetical protein